MILYKLPFIVGDYKKKILHLQLRGFGVWAQQGEKIPIIVKMTCVTVAFFLYSWMVTCVCCSEGDT